MRRLLLTAALVAVAAPQLAAQQFATEDPVLRRIWTLGMDSSHIYRLAQVLTDSVGPRLTGSPGQKSAHDWAVRQYQQWGITARQEQYGTWRGWRRGYTHIDLVQPRVRTLEGTLLAWSPGTNGQNVEAPVIVLPTSLTDSAALAGWLPQVRGKFVAISYAEPTCRPNRQMQEFAVSTQWWDRFRADRDSARVRYNRGVSAMARNANTLRTRLEAAGARGVLQSNWSQDYGVNKIFSTNTQRIPTVDLSCEDYGLVYRLAANNQGPVVRLNATSEFTGTVPTWNTIAEIKGSEKPNEYVLLSAHFDSWESSSGATDNATGTVTMMEAMRLLKAAYPNPKRTILVGHWSGEEQGLNGSRAFAKDHPEIVEGLQALFNQDNGTGRVQTISAQGLVGAGAHLASWLSRIPNEISQHIRLQVPGSPGGGGSDYASFICAGAPAFNLSSLDWGYGTYTWHTNRDTFDKIVIDEVKNNAVLTAMLAYLASEDPVKVSRERRAVMPRSPVTGNVQNWPTCQDGARAAPAN
jgi:carboxypeptidase Q